MRKIHAKAHFNHTQFCFSSTKKPFVDDNVLCRLGAPAPSAAIPGWDAEDAPRASQIHTSIGSWRLAKFVLL